MHMIDAIKKHEKAQVGTTLFAQESDTREIKYVMRVLETVIIVRKKEYKH